MGSIIPSAMKPENLIIEEVKNHLSFLVRLKESTKDLESRIRSSALYLASIQLMEKHPDIDDWSVEERPDESVIRGIMNEKLKVLAKVKTMGLTGRAVMGGRQGDSIKRALDQIVHENAQVSYLFLIDSWTAQIVRESVQEPKVRILSLISHISAVEEGDRRIAGKPAKPVRTEADLVEDVITKDGSIPEDDVIVSPISRTSLRQGFIYIPKEKGELVSEGPITIWIRKDASLESRCMISQTGGIRIGGNLTKWFRSAGLQEGDELVMGHRSDGSLLMLSIRRKSPIRGDPPVIESMKWD
ncbi:MAG: hypothetical protein QCI82_03365 [Candidatus Thermoplasmatota archaeon]|nr:hypothetical protein [Candidatus Thermoplasmatota archaeon]